MMKILVLKSSYSEAPLAEIRTDGRIIEFVVDNSKGKLPAQVGNSLDALKQLVDGSSHLSLEEPKQATVGLHRYILDNGDVVEVTTDGKTAMLNGKLLQQQEKDALFAAIKRKEINVKRKADIEESIPLFGSAQQKSPTLPAPPEGFRKAIMDEIDAQEAERKAIRKRATKAYDEEIEKAVLRGCEDPEWVRKLLYDMKYGED